MLSSDKNVENIGQLVELLKHYLGLQAEYVKLDVIDKVVRLLTAAALAIVFFLLIIAVMLFFSFSFAYWIGLYIGMAPAFLVVGHFIWCCSSSYSYSTTNGLSVRLFVS